MLNELERPVERVALALRVNEEDRQAFMQDLNLTGFSRDETLRNIFHGMNQIVFFTVGEDECRAWAIPKGATSPSWRVISGLKFKRDPSSARARPMRPPRSR